MKNGLEITDYVSVIMKLTNEHAGFDSVDLMWTSLGFNLFSLFNSHGRRRTQTAVLHAHSGPTSITCPVLGNEA